MYRLLTEFQNLFSGKLYRHRSSTSGDFVALHLYEDLVALSKSTKLASRVDSKEWGINTGNTRQGINARRGDGTFGELVSGETVITDPGYLVSRGKVATVEIGAEVKILHKSMIKQIDRVMNDLRNQVDEFRRGGDTPICVGIVGINHAQYTVGYEGDRSYRTGDKQGGRHPYQEAVEAEQRLLNKVAPAFDVFLILRYRATNEDPYPFEWVDYTATTRDYGAALIRMSREYDRRF
ncbi:MAG: hypothetical protein H0X37_21475 [Herpetosiphonaceae bacterium]|nr:hypothetical protein [Herpetosiphonaceae bacterium]